MLEMLLRIHDPFKFRVRGDKIVLPANVDYTFKNNSLKKLDQNIIHKKNSLGFRGEEPPKNFENYLTIITVGGSTTECFYLSDDKQWTYVLGMNLKNHFKKLWINNAGLDGHSTFGHIVLMEDYIVKLKPKIVLFLVGINDMGMRNLKFHDSKMLKTLSFESIAGLLISIANYSETLTLALNMYR
jgi:lysophospholipase L1-like esterase